MLSEKITSYYIFFVRPFVTFTFARLQSSAASGSRGQLNWPNNSGKKGRGTRSSLSDSRSGVKTGRVGADP